MENLTYTTKKNQNAGLADDVRENTTFYYSNFKLFHEDSELLFASYISFKKNLQTFLGDDWESYAKKTIYNTIDGATTYVQGKDIFGIALEVWLEQREKFNLNEEEMKLLNNKTNKLLPDTCESEESKSTYRALDREESVGNDLFERDHEPSEQFLEEEKDEKGEAKEGEISAKKYEKDMSLLSESGNDDLKGFEVYQHKVREKFTENQINEAFFGAIIHAFYISAMKIWKTTHDAYSYKSGQGQSFIEESKRFLLSKLQNVYKTKFKTLKPILVATEKIRDYSYNDNSKNFMLSPVLKMEDQKSMEYLSSSLRLENFSNLNIPSFKYDEEQDLKASFNELRINQGDTSVLGKRSLNQANSTVEIKKMNKKYEKLLNPNMVEFAAHYVNTSTKTSSLDWQITRSFVTNMVEVNYNRLLQLENRLSIQPGEMKNEVKIRFIQPAQDFYNSLMEVWVIFKAGSLDKDIMFNDYLEKVKNSLGDVWNEKFLPPTHNFFMTLYYEWHHLKHVGTNTEEKILLFVKKVKEGMLKIWDDNIVKKVEELSNKTITPQ